MVTRCAVAAVVHEVMHDVQQVITFTYRSRVTQSILFFLNKYYGVLAKYHGMHLELLPYLATIIKACTYVTGSITLH